MASSNRHLRYPVPVENRSPYSAALLDHVDYVRSLRLPQDQPLPLPHPPLPPLPQEEPLDQFLQEQAQEVPHDIPEPLQEDPAHQEEVQVLLALVQEAMTDHVWPLGGPVLPWALSTLLAPNDGEYVLVKPPPHYYHEQTSASTTPLRSPSASMILTRPTSPFMFDDDDYDHIESSEAH
ncbi:hypothetical protein CPC16_006560 [Podila verticillata]|nr:hypothetical protein BGZ52_007365 [Haplosporangium bisporale]KAF9211062.1 hypothetical protein BGZ59_008566 [Podila verticillata]KAF9388331.1 hypothetical protein CPC16_006560 [Podila verticillata]KFH67828.1 hypothetical protein MVEG_06560 [Podila verticillata NRRL 6337]